MINANGLNQILTQKYLALFQNSGQEAYFNYRRTGIPAFHAGPGTGNSGIIPKRWLYPSSESFYNEANLKTALARQFGSAVDDVEGCTNFVAASNDGNYLRYGVFNHT